MQSADPDQNAIPTQRRIERQKKRALLLHRIEAAIQSGQVDIYNDWKPTEEIAITGGELVLLLRLLFPEDYFSPPLASEPTTTAPGSAARALIMADRISRGQSAFHPGDASPTTNNEYDIAVSFNNSMKGIQIEGWGKRSPNKNNRDSG